MKTERNTIQKKMILDAVNTLKCHVTADDVYQYIKKDYPSISKATVYRDLNQLAENGDIKKIENIGECDRFDHITHNHYHIKCDKCGKLFDIDMDYMGELAQKIKDKHGFVFGEHDIIFKGLCPDCAEK